MVVGNNIERKTILRFGLWSALVVVFLLSVGFTETRSNHQPVSGLEASIVDSTGHSFVTLEEIEELVAVKYGDITARTVGSINMAMLEKSMLANPFVSTARVFSTIDGKLHVEVAQRTPILRVINFNNESYYIDDGGRFMPLSDQYTARVPVASGYLFQREAEGKVHTCSDAALKDSVTTLSKVAQVFMVAKFVHNDPFWSSQVEQLFMNAAGDIELVPRVGDHTVLLGDASDLEAKFAKLYLFYTEGLSKTGWNKYSTINLKYSGQVVCTKR